LPRNPRSLVIHFRGFAIATEFVNVAEIVQGKGILWIYLICLGKEFARVGRIVMV
jgi:hypothetical protein